MSGAVIEDGIEETDPVASRMISPSIAMMAMAFKLN
jgi:hypothetical protein